MMRNFGFVAPALLTLGLVAYACTSGEVVDGPATGAGGNNPVGTAGTDGGSRGGTVGSAGTNGGSRGGTVGSAGTTGSGRGGTVGSAGTTGSGRGGTVGSAGTSGPAGTNGGGTAGTMGTSTCPPTFSVSSNGFVQMPISGGCWSGYPYTYADSYGTTVMPAPMASFTTNMLRLTGNIVAVSGAMYSYAGIGFSLGQTASGETPVLVTPTGTGLTFNVTNSTSGTGVIIRAQVTNGTTTWCKDMTTFPATITWAGFTVNCYTPGGAAYNKEPIKGIEVNIAGGTGAGTINLTINSITQN